ncbi:MAG: hypothetical protein Q9163_001780 [Psora crenata]
MSGNSNVGGGSVYEAGDQRTVPNSEINQAERYKEGQPHSHLANDSRSADPHDFSEDQRSIANRLGREEQAKNHGNEPSKGAKIDAEIKAEEEEMLKKKGAWGSKQ